MSNTHKPVHEVFMRRARGIGHILRNHVDSMKGFAANEKLSPNLVINGDNTTLQYYRDDGGDRHSYKHDGCVQIGAIQPADAKNIEFGAEHIDKSEVIAENVLIFDNRGGDSDLEVDLRSSFGESEESETSESAGASVSIEIESEQDISGVAKFREQIQAEAHTEISKRRTASTTNEDDYDESMVVLPGKRKKVTQRRSRASGEIAVTAHGDFTYSVMVGYHSHYWHHGIYWATWEEFSDVIQGDAPDNCPLSQLIKRQPLYHADMWVLDDIDSELRYSIKFEGRNVIEYIIADDS